MKFSNYRGISLAFLVLATACGGGGGDQNQAAPYSITLDKANVMFEADVQGDFPATQTVNVAFAGDGVVVGYPPGVPSGASWLNVSVPSNVSGNSVQVTLSVQSTGLTPDVYSTTLRFATGKADGSAVVYQDLPVQYTVHDRLVLSSTNLLFTSVAGTSQAPSAQTLSITPSNASTAWGALVDQTWVTLDKTQGQGPGSIQIQVDPTGMDAGPHLATLTLSKQDGQPPVTVGIRLTLKSRRITVSRSGLALSAVPGQGILRRDVGLYDNVGISGNPWSAVSDKVWLQIESITNNRLTVVADPSSLAAGMNYATVTVSSSAPKVENQEVIQVGLWKSTDTPIDGALVDLMSEWIQVEGLRLALAIDPVRPWVYFVDSSGSVVKAFNVYTGVKEAEFPAVTGEAFCSLVASSDGRYLFACSSANTILYRLDLSSGTWNSGFHFQSQYLNPSRMTYLRPEGRPIIFLQEAGLFIDGETGSPLSTDLPLWSTPIYTASEDQSHLLGPARYQLEFDPSAKTVSALQTNAIPLQSDFKDVACNWDGSRVYMVGSGFEVYSLDVSGYTYIGSWTSKPYPAAVEVGDNGILYAAMDNYYDPDTVYAYGSDGTNLKTYTIGTYKFLLTGDKGLRISGDGQRLMIVSTEFSSGDKTTLWGFQVLP